MCFWTRCGARSLLFVALARFVDWQKANQAGCGGVADGVISSIILDIRVYSIGRASLVSEQR